MTDHSTPYQNEKLLSQFIRESPWAKYVDEKAINTVTPQCKALSLKTGEFLCRKGEPVKRWFGVINGVIKLSSDAASGKTSTLAGITAGGWFGEGSMLKNEPRKFDAITLRNSLIVFMPHETFDWLLDNYIGFNRYLLLQLNERLGHFIGTLESERLLGSNARLALCLAQLYNPVLYPKTQATLEVSQSELGYLCGLSRQRINQALQYLQRENVLRVGYRTIEIINLEQLKFIALS